MGDQEANGPAEAAMFSEAAAKVTKIYVGGLPTDLEEDELKAMLTDKGVPEAESVLLKRGGYAFLEFADQSMADEAIAAVDGKILVSVLLLVPFSKSEMLGLWGFFFGVQ